MEARCMACAAESMEKEAEPGDADDPRFNIAVIFACNDGGMGAFPPLFANIPLKVLRGAPPAEGGGRGAGLCDDTTAGAGLGAL